MTTNFPIIKNLDHVSKAIAGRDEFIIAERDWGYVVNYLVNFEDTFPTPNTHDPELNEIYRIRRECRGIKFSKNGEILARPYHKFYNLGERPETLQNNIDWSQEFIILDKLDGSMIHPIVVDNQVVLCTKMGPTEVAMPVQHFAENKGYNNIYYLDFCYDLQKSGMTPIFEWTSRQQKIVVDYPNDNLVLTGVRENVTGKYKSYDQMLALAEPYNIPVVNMWDNQFNDIQSFVNRVRNMDNTEGFIIRFNNGYMLKVKADWYILRHKTKENITLEKNVLNYILSDAVDDILPLVSPEEANSLVNYQQSVLTHMKQKADDLNCVVIEAKDNLNNSKKRFALEYINNPKKRILDNEKGLLFKIWDGYDPYEVVKDYVKANLGSQSKVNNIRNLIGLKQWMSNNFDSE